MKNVKKAPKVAHTSNSPKGMGDFYGSGVRNPVGRAIDVFQATPVKGKKIGKPPKSLA